MPPPTHGLPQKGAITQIGRFAIERVIGRGGMSVVFFARDPSGTGVALKLLQGGPEILEDTSEARFMREASILQRVDHQGVVRLIDFGRYDGQLYIAMEHLEGITLGDVRRNGLIEDPSFIVAIGKEITDALTALHAAGIKHRDLKPDNVLIQPSGRVVLIDFGIARLDSGQPLTSTGQALGSPGYVAPEILSGRPVSEASDQYSLGRLLFELSAVSPPAALEKGLPVLDRFNRRLAIDWSRFPKGPGWDEVEGVVRRMLSRKPRARFSSAGDCHLALTRILGALRPAGGTHRILQALVDATGLQTRDLWSDQTRDAFDAGSSTKDAIPPPQNRQQRARPTTRRAAQVLTGVAAALVVMVATLVGIGGAEHVLTSPEAASEQSIARGMEQDAEAVEHLTAGRFAFAEQVLERCVRKSPTKACRLRLQALRLLTGRPGIRLKSP